MNEISADEIEITEQGIKLIKVPMLIYVAGPLNDLAVGFIQNLHQMLKFGNMVRWKGHSPYIPGLDLLLGLVDGKMEYDDYFNMSQPWLEALAEIHSRSTGMWYTGSSPGADRELETADRLGIRVFRIYDDIPWTIKAYEETLVLVDSNGAGQEG